MEIRKVLDWFDLAETRLNIGRDWMFDFWNSKCEERGTCSRSELQSAKESHFCTINFNLNKPATQIKRNYHVIRPVKDGVRWYNFDRLFQIDKWFNVGAHLAWSTWPVNHLWTYAYAKFWMVRYGFRNIGEVTSWILDLFVSLQWLHDNFWKLQKLEDMVILKILLIKMIPSWTNWSDGLNSR